MHPVDATLLTVIMVLGLTCALSWAGMAYGMQLAPKASYRFAAANLCIALGMVLNMYRTDMPAFLYSHVSDWLVLTGLLGFRSGIQMMLNMEESRWYQRVLPLAVAIALTLPLPPQPSSHFMMAVVFASVGGWISLDSARIAYRGLRASRFSRSIAVALSAPLSDRRRRDAHAADTDRDHRVSAAGTRCVGRYRHGPVSVGHGFFDADLEPCHGRVGRYPPDAAHPRPGRARSPDGLLEPP